MYAQTATKPTDEIVAGIQALDLEPIVFKATHPQGDKRWPREYADFLAAEYRKFLTLLVKYPDETIAPTTEVDEFWHLHILDTRKYAADCEAVFGYFLHHFPYFGMRSEEDAKDLERAGKQWHNLYELEFGASETSQPSAKPAWCYAAIEAKTPAWCYAAVTAKQPAWCYAAVDVKKPAWCYAAVVARNPAWCYATVEAKKPSWCYAAKDAKQPAWCYAAVKSKQPSWCYAAVEAKQPAWCYAAVEAKQPAWCYAAIDAKKASWCYAAIDAKKPSWCYAAIKQEALAA
jgi:hypothetical protein